MAKLELENLILHKFPSLVDVRLHDFIYDKANKQFDGTILVKNNCVEEKELQEYLCHLLDCNCIMRVKTSYVDEDYIKLRISRFFGKNGGFLKPALSKLDFDVKKEEENKYTLVFYGNKNFCSYMEGSLKDSLIEYLYRCFICDFNIKCVEMFDNVTLPPIRERELRAIEVKNSEMFIGKPITELAGFICDIDGVYDNAIIAGKVINLVERTRKNPPKENARNKNPIYFTFSVQDCSGTFPCIMFPSIGNTPLVREMNGMEGVFSGKISIGRYGEQNMMVDKITKCEIVTKTPPKDDNEKEEPIYYNTVFPEPVMVYQQDNMLEQRKQLDLSKFEGKTIVVFDLETTGLDRMKSKIVEIGGVKMVDGKFTEKFSSLINPQIPIPKETSLKNNITDEMVKNCPTWEEVVQDFYKFSYGCILCGHNILDFDMPILNNQSKAFGYKFTNKTIDTVILSRMYVKGARDNTLKSLCDKYNVTNENAHRAYEDSIATGQILIGMINEYDKIEL